MPYHSLEYDEENNNYWPLDLFVRLDCGGAEVYYQNKQRGTTERHIYLQDSEINHIIHMLNECEIERYRYNTSKDEFVCLKDDIVKWSLRIEYEDDKEEAIDIKVERENGESVLLMPKAINKIIEYIKGLIILSDVLE